MLMVHLTPWQAFCTELEAKKLISLLFQTGSVLKTEPVELGICRLKAVLRTRLTKTRYAYALDAHGVVAFLVTRQMPLDPVQPECQGCGQHPDGVIAGEVLQIGLDGREVPRAVSAHDGNQAAVFRAYVVGEQAQEQIILHFLQIMPPSRRADQGVVARIPPIELFFA